MLAIPLPIRYYLKPLLRVAEEAGFAGLVFVIARTIDAPQQHEELSKHWASMHDVTGPLIGVVWPSDKRDLAPYPSDEAAALRFGLSGTDNSAFSRAFWNLAAEDPELGWALEKQRQELKRSELVYSQAPVPQQDLVDAWSTAASDSAEYFGLDEGRTPCVVILSLPEHRALVLPLNTTPSIYKLLRATRIALGAKPGEISELCEEQRAIATTITSLEYELGGLVYGGTRRTRSWRGRCRTHTG